MDLPLSFTMLTVALVAHATPVADTARGAPGLPAPALPPMPSATAEHHRLFSEMEGCVWSGVRRELAAGARNQDQIVSALDYCRAPLVSSGYMTPARAGAVYRETVAEALEHITDGDPAAGF